MKIWQLSPCLIVISALVLSGCGAQTGPKLYPVSGTVLYNGEPVEGAVVAFHNPGASGMSTGRTDSQGRFSLTTDRPGDGAIPGKHSVTVSKFINVGDAPEESMSMEEAAEVVTQQPVSQNELPEKYASTTSSGLELDVSESGENDFTIELVD